MQTPNTFFNKFTCKILAMSAFVFVYFSIKAKTEPHILTKF